MFTSAPVVDGRRRIFHENNRLGLADGCLLLGLEMDGSELSRLVADGFPFVAIGRRETPGVSFVGVDYVSATAELARRALELGHEKFFYLHLDSTGESVLDRQQGFASALEELDSSKVGSRATNGSDLAADWVAIREFAPTVLFVEVTAHARVLYDLAAAAGISVPDELSIVVLGEPSRVRDQDVDFTRLSPPRTELGARAVALLAQILSTNDQPADEERQVLLDCTLVNGTTLAQAPGAQ
jgi:DNA-binding LacI/PurR family transcriptional regulator